MRFADRKTISPGYFREIACRGHGVKIDREVGMGHLRLEDALQAVAAQEFRSKTVKVKSILCRIKRRKERNALNVVPVVVGDEDMRVRQSCPVAAAKRFPSMRKPGAAIQDEARRRREWSVRGKACFRRSATWPGPPSAWIRARPRSSVWLLRSPLLRNSFGPRATRIRVHQRLGRRKRRKLKVSAMVGAR